RHGSAGVDVWPAVDRHGAGEGGGPLLRAGWRSPARSWHDPGSRRNRHPCRASLCSAGDAALRNPCHVTGVAGVLQYARGDRRPRARYPEGERGVRVTPELRELYQGVILDHYKKPRNFRALEAGRSAEGSNPLCGDRINVYLKLDGDVIKEVTFVGSGCA